MREKPVSARLLFCNCAKKKKSTFIFPNGMTFDTPSPHPSPNSSLSRRKNHLEHWRDTIEIFHIYCKYGKVSHHSIGHGTTDQFRSWVYITLSLFWGNYWLNDWDGTSPPQKKLLLIRCMTTISDQPSHGKVTKSSFLPHQIKPVIIFLLL